MKKKTHLHLFLYLESLDNELIELIYICKKRSLFIKFKLIYSLCQIKKQTAHIN